MLYWYFGTSIRTAHALKDIIITFFFVSLWIEVSAEIEFRRLQMKQLMSFLNLEFDFGCVQHSVIY